MKIGDFAKSCGVSISVLHFYNKKGLLCPYYIDPFTGYRYYSESQKNVCKRINLLKSCGFSLSQIKKILSCETKEEFDSIFETQKQELEKMLLSLSETKKKIMDENTKKGELFLPHKDDIDLPFQNDEEVIGKWEILTENTDMPHTKKREIYFLPEGCGYWCYGGWTKGFLFLDDGCNTSKSEYTLEKKNGQIYMNVNFSSFDHWNGGETEKIVLKKIDSRRYTKDDIRIRENTNMPFVNDSKVLGKWTAHDFILKKSDFSANPDNENFVPYFKAVEFLPDGVCISVYGDKIIDSSVQSWTKGYVLRKFNDTACKYEIKRVKGQDYLIVEWKSGDYRWGGFKTDYYVFVRS